MQRYLLLLFMLLYSTAGAAQWIIIYPLPHCPSFSIEYQQTSKGYSIRYLPKPDSKEYVTYPHNLKDINNLSALTDDLTEMAKDYCPMEFTISFGREHLVCKKPMPEDPFSDVYADLLRDIVGGLKGTSCDDVLPLIELQNQISNLRGDQLIKFNKKGRFLRLFVGQDTDKLIDHFYECGGKKGSKKFIRNMIMMEAKNACVFPESTGLLSFDKTMEIADKLAAKYPNMSLLKLNSKKNDITREAILTFIDEIFDSQIASLLGPDFDATELLNSLESVKAIKKEKSKYLLDHISYITPLNAPLEIVDKGLPSIIESNFVDILPESMTKEERLNFIKYNIVPKVVKKYDECIDPIKTRLNYPTMAPSNEVIKHRKGLEKMYCKNNLDECKKDNCSSVKNLLTDRKDINDMQMIQACVFQSFSVALEPTLDKIIRGQKETLNQYVDMNEKTIEAVKKSALKTLNQCADRKLRKKTSPHLITKESTYANDIELLYKINSTEFQDIIAECSRITEDAQVKDFIAIIIDSVPLVKKTFGTNEEIEVIGIKVDKGSHEFSKKIINNTIPACNEAQSFRVRQFPGQLVSTLNCTPLIEMEAGKAIIEVTIDETLKEYGIDPKSSSIVKDMRKCIKSAEDDFLTRLLNKNHPEPVLNSSDATDYLAKNHEYYGCVKNTVLGIADVAAQKVMDQTLEQAGSQVMDMKFLYDLKGPVITKLKQCFSNKLNEIGNWPAFLDYNNRNGLTILQTECEDEVTKFALPKVIINETRAQVAQLYEVKLTDPKEFDAIYTNLLNEMQKDIGLKLNARTPASQEIILAKAYQHFKDTHPASQDVVNDFVTYYSEKAEPAIVGGIGQSILDGVMNNNSGHNLKNLSKHLPAQCIASFYMQNKQNINDLIELIEEHDDPESEPIENLKDEFISIVTAGLVRAKNQGRYNQLMKDLKLVCANPANYKDLSKLVDTGIGDDLILALLEETISKEFKEIAKKQCEDSLDKNHLGIILAPFPNLKKDLCETEIKSANDLKRIEERIVYFLTDPKDKSMVNLILGRRFDTINLITEKMEDPNFIDKTFYQDRHVLDYIYKNLDEVIAGVDSTNNHLGILAVEQLFEDKSKNSFAEKFVESQLVYSIGDKAFQQVDEGIDKMLKEIEDLWFYQNPKKYATKGMIKRFAKPAFHKLWNYNNIKDYIALDKTDKRAKEQLIDYVYTNAIATELDANCDEADKKSRSKILEDYINDHLQKNRVHKNPKYKPKKKISEKNQKYLNFEEKISYEIEEEITKNITTVLKAGAASILIPRISTPILFF